MYDEIYEAVDKRKNNIIALGRDIYMNPELGFKEFKTAKIVTDELKKLGLDVYELKDIPGVKATFDTGIDGPGIAVIGELDSVICYDHPDCDKETGAVHACGHNVQIADMIGAASVLVALAKEYSLCGKIHFIAVPAEEYIEVEYRLGLREQGRIRYLGGKPELLARGFFDDVDICIMLHQAPSDIPFLIGTSMNGCIVKNVRYIGKAAHAGAAPHDGINALYAANLGMSAVNSLRETFKEEDSIRVHPIITKGGDIVNVIPSDVRIETFVRGRTIESIINTNKKINKAFLGGAHSMGAKIEIYDLPGYIPLKEDVNLEKAAETIMKEIEGENAIAYIGHQTGSSDIGDLSALMPVFMPYVGGVEGGLHSALYRITDTEKAYINGTKLLAALTVKLLSDKAQEAYKVIKAYKPLFQTKEDYFAAADALFNTIKRDYSADED